MASAQQEIAYPVIVVTRLGNIIRLACQPMTPTGLKTTDAPLFAGKSRPFAGPGLDAWAVNEPSGAYLAQNLALLHIDQHGPVEVMSQTRKIAGHIWVTSPRETRQSDPPDSTWDRMYR
jgi:hypothetical protein